MKIPTALLHGPLLQAAGCATDYTLSAVVMHRGAIHSGHYYAYMKSPGLTPFTTLNTPWKCNLGSDDWICYNDAQVTSVSCKQVLQSRAQTYWQWTCSTQLAWRGIPNSYRAGRGSGGVEEIQICGLWTLTTATRLAHQGYNVSIDDRWWFSIARTVD